MFTPVNRAIEGEETLELAVDVDHALAVDEAQRAANGLVNERQRGAEFERADAILSGRRQEIPRDPMRFTMAGQTGGFLFFGDRPKSVDTQEVAKSLERIELTRIVLDQKL